MFKKDYLLRMVQFFFDALRKILNNIEKGEVNIATDQIGQLYELLGESSDFFLNTDIDKLLDFLKGEGDNALKKVSMVGELLYLDSLVKENTESKKLFLKKAILLLEYYLSNSNEYSFELNGKLLKMKKELNYL